MDHRNAEAAPAASIASTARRAAALLAALLACLAMRAGAATTDIAQTPLASGGARPNLMFVLDDSGSMQSSYLPDSAYTNGYTNTVGYRSALCNRLYYDPALRYAPAVDADGNAFAPTRFDAAFFDGFDPKETVDLSTGFTAWRSFSSQPPTPTGRASDCWYYGQCVDDGSGVRNLPEPAYYFVYQGGRADRLGDNSSADDCKDTRYDSDGSATGANWRKVVVGAQSGPGGSDERQNFANWFSYYRTRILLIKTSLGLAFRDIDSGFRIGYTTIGYPGVDSSKPDFLKIADADNAQKAALYRKLYGKLIPASGTPLRGALSKVGRMYAGRLLTGADDPVQYSCQQNFAIVSTDGYWNTNVSAGVDEGAGYGPLDLDGKPVGNRDARLPRPMYDGTPTAPFWTGSIAVNGFGNTSVAAIRVGPTSLLAQPTAAFSDPAALAAAIASGISASGFSASARGNVVRIDATDASLSAPASAIVDGRGGMGFVVTPFSRLASDSGGAQNSLADVASYYYETDLRDSALANCTGALGTDVCANNVFSSPEDPAVYQHMTTFTIGLGVDGLLRFRDDYASAPTGDYADIASGAKNWPSPQDSEVARVDDLWHAAVNGHGVYFSARNASTLGVALRNALARMRQRVGNAAAAAVSNLEPVPGDNLVFSARYRSVFWDGDIEARTIDPATGEVADTASWKTQAQLDDKARAGSRVILTWDAAAPNRVKAFAWDALNADEKAMFSGLCAASKLSQCTELSAAQQGDAGGGKLVDYLRGSNDYADRPGTPNGLFRQREHVLGDIVNAQPLYVGAPAFGYADANYAAFRALRAPRSPMLYVAANDGMLHAFRASGANAGSEAWAYVPPQMLPELWRLADRNYGALHRFFVDGTPVAADICPKAPGAACSAEEWRTILVGGFGTGGRGYYALDITDPEAPAALWNLSGADDADIGLSFGKPLVAKRADGAWTVAFTSGYNNVAPGSGGGYLFLVRAADGSRLDKIATGAGDAATPSGLGQINAWVDNRYDNTARRYYGGDLLGNVWRFDVDGPAPPAGRRALLLARLGDAAGTMTQPVTTRPELALVRAGGADLALVAVGTGRYLGRSDIADRSLQSLYVLRDPLGTDGLGQVRENGKLLQRQLMLADDGVSLGVDGAAVDWNAKSGWYVDLKTGDAASGERIDVDMQLQLGVLKAASNTPSVDVCSIGGSAMRYAFDLATGLAPPGALRGTVAYKVSSGALLTGIDTLRLQGGRTSTLLADSAGMLQGVRDPAVPAPASAPKRISWRELPDR
jgi:type IV pilus assembly protein PilY1